jgi:tRNA threonylcarbamoyladenosine biosynthesis protein TsaE
MPILAAHSLEVISRSAEQTRRVGMRLGALLQHGDLVCLVGDLGSGKTTLVQGIGAGWGSLDQVSSPTFVIINVYRRPGDERLYHLDAYRLSGPEEVIDLDLDAYLEAAPMVVEWADRIEKALPEDCLRIHLTYVAEDQRDMLIQAMGARSQALLVKLRMAVYGG